MSVTTQSETEVRQGHVRRLFPGSNTGYGFYSFYDQIIPEDATRIFVIKGGPGVGKSTFMRRIAREMVAGGRDVEVHGCSADNDSVDAVVIPSLDVALLDGTSPHVVDPKNPGAVDEIIHLGDHWDEAGMRGYREQILKINAEVGRLFRRAYALLKTARDLNQQLDSYPVEAGALDIPGLNRQGEALVKEVFDGAPMQDRKARVRRMFATAITPKGATNHLETLMEPLGRRIIIRGEAGTGRTTLVEKVVDRAQVLGYDVEAFHCALDPEHIDHAIIHSLDVAVINGSPPHSYAPQDGDLIIETDRYVEGARLAPVRAEMEELRRLYRQVFDRSVTLLQGAKEAHDDLEEFYVPNMDFEAVEERRQQVVERILSYGS